MTIQEFQDGIHRLETHRPGQSYGPELTAALYRRFQAWPAWAWERAVSHLLDNHKIRALPVQADMVTALDEVGGDAKPQHQRQTAPEPEMSLHEVAASRCYKAEIVTAMADGKSACDELALVAKDVDEAVEGECPCRDGVVIFHRLPTNPRHAYAGPCPNGCGRAEKFGRAISGSKALAVVDIDTGAFVRWAHNLGGAQGMPAKGPMSHDLTLAGTLP